MAARDAAAQQIQLSCCSFVPALCRRGELLQMYLTDVEEGGETVFPHVPKLPHQTLENGWSNCSLQVGGLIVIQQTKSCVRLHSVNGHFANTLAASLQGPEGPRPVNCDLPPCSAAFPTASGPEHMLAKYNGCAWSSCRSAARLCRAVLLVDLHSCILGVSVCKAWP